MQLRLYNYVYPPKLGLPDLFFKGETFTVSIPNKIENFSQQRWISQLTHIQNGT